MSLPLTLLDLITFNVIVIKKTMMTAKQNSKAKYGA